MKLKHILSVLVVMMLLMVPFNAVMAETKYDVLALGDSLAAGMNEKGDIAKGYADFLADFIAENDQLSSFNKGFSYPGYKTTNVLADMEADVEKVAKDQNLKDGPKIKLSEGIQEAEIITLSVGANDVLSTLTRNADGTFTYEYSEVTAAIAVVKENVAQILSNIKELNEEAEIVVMGYYNPFPKLTNMAFQLNTLVNMLDSAVKEVVEQQGALFIDVKTDIANNASTYLPNPDNIHLSAAGYEAVGMKMYDALGFPPIVPFEYPTDVKESAWYAPFIKKAMKQQIFFGYPDGTFKPNQSIKRIEVTSLFARQFNLPASSEQVPFKDVSKVSATMLKELQAVYAAGIVSGHSKDVFGPNENITREHFVAILLRTHEKVTGEKQSVKDITTFTDIQKLSAESQRAIKFATEVGLVEPVTKFNPLQPITRAEAAKILVRYGEIFE